MTPAGDKRRATGLKRPVRPTASSPPCRYAVVWCARRLRGRQAGLVSSGPAGNRWVPFWRVTTTYSRLRTQPNGLPDTDNAHRGRRVQVGRFGSSRWAAEGGTIPGDVTRSALPVAGRPTSTWQAARAAPAARPITTRVWVGISPRSPWREISTRPSEPSGSGAPGRGRARQSFDSSSMPVHRFVRPRGVPAPRKRWLQLPMAAATPFHRVLASTAYKAQLAIELLADLR